MRIRLNVTRKKLTAFSVIALMLCVYYIVIRSRIGIRQCALFGDFFCKLNQTESKDLSAASSKSTTKAISSAKTVAELCACGDLCYDRLNKTRCSHLGPGPPKSFTKLVPNIVHYIRFDEPELDFGHFISIKSVLKHHKPDTIYIHCNFEHLTGKYWDLLKNDTTIAIRKIEKPTKIFGHKLSHIWHMGDVARIKILTKLGGIYLDNDEYVVQSLDSLRYYEYFTGIDIGGSCDWGTGTQFIIAQRNARFLAMWLNGYKNYNKDSWYYNAGIYPYQQLVKNTNLANVDCAKVGAQGHYTRVMLYCEDVNYSVWKDFYAVHLYLRHQFPECTKMVQFDETNIKTDKRTIGQMMRLVLYNTTDLIYN